MKMRNDDLKKITEIKQYLLDPPVSFKLYDYAPGYVNDAINVLSGYDAVNDAIIYLQNLKSQLENNEITQDELRSTLKQAGMQISRLTSK